MWLAVKALLIRWALGKSFGGLVSLLLFLALPLAGVLKVIGLPLLIVLAIVGLPMILLLAVIGLPLLLVVGTVSLLMSVVGGVLAAGLVVLKFALPIILIVWLARWGYRKLSARPGDAGAPPATSPPTDDPVI